MTEHGERTEATADEKAWAMGDGAAELLYARKTYDHAMESGTGSVGEGTSRRAVVTWKKFPLEKAD